MFYTNSVKQPKDIRKPLNAICLEKVPPGIYLECRMIEMDLISSHPSIFHSICTRAITRRRRSDKGVGVWFVTCRSLGNGQAATLLQSNILLKTRRYRDKISTCYCRAVPVPFQRLYKVFCGIGGFQNRTHANHCSIISVGGAHACGQRCATSEP